MFLQLPFWFGQLLYKGLIYQIQPFTNFLVIRFQLKSNFRTVNLNFVFNLQYHNYTQLHKVLDIIALTFCGSRPVQIFCYVASLAPKQKAFLNSNYIPQLTYIIISNNYIISNYIKSTLAFIFWKNILKPYSHTVILCIAC